MSLSSGAIVRLYLKNFLTYSEVEFNPRSGLNMIVGPNGSGKSSLVCGICLVLAGKPNVLGRAPHLKEFIKFGCSHAELEIELFQPQANKIIRRTIHDRGSDWKINGIPCSQNEVCKEVSKMNIQVDNLCQFLPQDRVADFVKMTPQELLVNTENAVGSAMLIENHEKLKSLQESLTSLKNKIESTKNHRDKEVQLNEHLEAELKQFKDFKAAKKQLELYEAKLAWLNYVVKRDNFLEKKKILNQKADVVEKQQEAHARIKGKVTRLENQIKELDRQKAQLELALRRVKEKTAKTREEMDKCTERMNEIQHTFKEQLDCEKERIDKEKVQRSTVQELQIKYHEELDKLREDRVETKLQEVKLRISGLNKELNKLNATMQERQQLVRSIEQEIQEYEERHRTLALKADPRMEMLEKIKPQEHIHKPVAAELTISNERQARYLEVILGSDSLFSFVAENPDDMELFVKEARRRNWKINIGTAPRGGRMKFANPVPKEQIKEFGVEGYVSDLCEASDAVFAFLCGLHNLHRVPFGGDILEDHIYGLLSKYQLNRAIAGSSLVNLVKSEYSTDLTRISKSIPKNKVLIVFSNREELQQVTERLKQLKQQKERSIGDYNKLKEEVENLNRIAQGVKDEEKKLRQRMGASLKLRDTLNVKKAQLQRLQQVPGDLEAKKRRVEACLNNDLALFRRNTKELVKDAEEAFEQLQKLGLVVCQIEETRQRAEVFNDELLLVERALTAAKAAYDRLEESTKIAKQEALQILEQAKNLVGLDNVSGRAAVQLPDKISAQFEELSNEIPEIEGFVAEERARLSLMMPHNMNVEKEYNRRQQLISEVNTTLNSLTSKLDEIKVEIATKDQEWCSELDALLGKINATFSRFFTLLGCEGKVTLYDGEAVHQYDRYGIKILVRFRENTDLCELTPTHQSGGERSVAIILYMMALQELTVVPFRVVDEINQGMDSVNERRVFEFLVKTAELNEAQYFLITPKLLTGLPYSEKMSVHFVYPNVGFTHHRWGLQKFIERQKRRRTNSTAIQEKDDMEL
ncbi:structural maintenance of chromosomes protein 5-like isoform X2 [Varroa destructor]|uniref:Structural maintenance of chromosomes protein 5 n=1 Tax=Varroa destructor TaxID=109461 RepID=A0A7M7JIX9_VARDE|nr:structural maintenance of chromosomes protein 5-like isoform X2 [Varroa destructor]